MRIKNSKAVSRYSTRRIKASEEIIDDVMDVEEEPSEAAVVVDPEATELVFEAEDVAELIAEISGKEVEVTVDTDAVVFNVGDDQFTVEPDGDEEILEASKKVLRGKKPVKASKKIPASRARRPIARRRHV